MPDTNAKKTCFVVMGFGEKTGQARCRDGNPICGPGVLDAPFLEDA